jgi:hypothetical protein
MLHSMYTYNPTSAAKAAADQVRTLNPHTLPHGGNPAPVCHTRVASLAAAPMTSVMSTSQTYTATVHKALAPPAALISCGYFGSSCLLSAALDKEVAACLESAAQLPAISS